MHLENILFGGAVFLIIGVFHPFVIKTEYYLGKRALPLFVLPGIFSAAAAFFLGGLIGILFAVLSCTCFWSIGEVTEQYNRVERGWFPAGPGHKPDKEKNSYTGIKKEYIE